MEGVNLATKSVILDRVVVVVLVVCVVDMAIEVMGSPGLIVLN